MFYICLFPASAKPPPALVPRQRLALPQQLSLQHVPTRSHQHLPGPIHQRTDHDAHPGGVAAPAEQQQPPATAGTSEAEPIAGLLRLPVQLPHLKPLQPGLRNGPYDVPQRVQAGVCQPVRSETP